MIESLHSIFNGNYPEADFRNVNVTVDFPMLPQNYPGVWVQFQDNQDLERAGIDEHETVVDDNGIQRQVVRWKFGGSFVFTVSALSSAERDRLFDEIVRVFAFSGIDQSPAGQLKILIETNDLIGIVLNYDVLTPSGEGATPGTPWDTNEVIYEKTLSIEMVGEFVSDAKSSVLYPLSRVIVQGFDSDEDPLVPEFAQTGDSSDETWDPTQWI